MSVLEAVQLHNNQDHLVSSFNGWVTWNARQCFPHPATTGNPQLFFIMTDHCELSPHQSIYLYYYCYFILFNYI